ncbi:hypothetical protein CWI42_020940 [Ordospora colligata]|uniref:Uncharacterized protein n=1 Tax=Ordospora colligata OC4 TaxID=1354746 RepID=A0A0B2ULT0_9MICR|nr:uncharacterized protein M896_020950 [Ordospora colligata OC4]KHN70258.1 hypothetical protein M896_020950 [Ordospora colligata OC4]TBU16802.1 hypothetical protein CWI41_020960 [Ordospora colligata]TBU16910.1 hypothetical protein CWI40_020960 [Ordospora colligata]TBU19351.1 hypothetical protein CWI42_020940 [Ordospora colligata]
MLVAVIVSLILAVTCFKYEEDSSEHSTDNVFTRFLENTINDTDINQNPKDKTHGVKVEDINRTDNNHIKELNQPQNTTKRLSMMKSKENAIKTLNTASTGRNKRYMGSKQKKTVSSQTEVQPDLTFETPISASLLLKPSNTQKDIVISQGDIKEMSDSLKEVEKLITGLNTLKNKLKSILKKTSQPSREDKPPTDLLNYNFIEVTENTQTESK